MKYEAQLYKKTSQFSNHWSTFLPFWNNFLLLLLVLLILFFTLDLQMSNSLNLNFGSVLNQILFPLDLTPSSPVIYHCLTLPQLS